MRVHLEHDEKDGSGIRDFSVINPYLILTSLCFKQYDWTIELSLFHNEGCSLARQYSGSLNE